MPDYERMQDDRGLKRLLGRPWIYDWFQNLIGAKRARRWIAETQWQAKPGMKVVDIGCGLGDALNYLPRDISYFGVDISEKYVRAARKTFADRRAEFLVSAAGDLRHRHDERMRDADLVICSGLLHHLSNDESSDVLQSAHELLRPGGRIVCVDPVWLECGSPLARLLMSRDRGCNIRTEQEWKDHLGRVFDSYQAKVRTNLIRIPYAHIILIGTKTAFNVRAA